MGSRIWDNSARSQGLRAGNPYVVDKPVGGGSAFVGREDLLRDVVQALAEQRKQGIVLYGQQRIGKSSILQHLLTSLPERSGHLPVYFDLQDETDASLETVLADLADSVARALRLPDPLPGPHTEAWFRDDWLPSALAKLPEGMSLVLLFDNFDLLVDIHARRATSEFFSYLQCLLDENAPSLRVVFVIGHNLDDLENVAHSLFKGMPSWRLSLLPRKESEMLIRLSEGNGSLMWSDPAVAAVWALTHGHPFLLQVVCSHAWVQASARSVERSVDVEDVQAAAEQALGTTRNAFEWLWKTLPPGKRLVAAALATAGPGPILEEELHRILNENRVRLVVREIRDAPRMLMDWDILEEPEPKHYQFRVELLRRMIARYKPLDRAQEDVDPIEPAALALYKAGEALYHEGRFDSAIARLEEAVELDPNHLRASDLLADVFISQRAWERAHRVLIRLYKTHPARARARLVSVLRAMADSAINERARLALYLRVYDVEKNIIFATEVREELRRHGNQERAAGRTLNAAYAYHYGGFPDLAAESITTSRSELHRLKRAAQFLALFRMLASMLLVVRTAHGPFSNAPMNRLMFGVLMLWFMALIGSATIADRYERFIGNGLKRRVIAFFPLAGIWYLLLLVRVLNQLKDRTLKELPSPQTIHK